MRETRFDMPDTFHFLTSNQKESIGLNYILDQFRPITPYGKTRKNHLKLYRSNEFNDLQKQLNYIDSFLFLLTQNQSILNNIHSILTECKEIRESIIRCEENLVLDDVELFEIKNILFLSNQLKSIWNPINSIDNDLMIEDLTTAYSILDPNNEMQRSFFIYDSYSHLLKEIRRKKKILELQLSQEIDSMVREQIKIKRLNLVGQENQEEFNIRQNLGNKLKKWLGEIKKNLKIIADLDFLFAKSRLIEKFSAIKPQFVVDPILNFEDIRNPMIEEQLQLKGLSFTPISINLKTPVSILTGANMGGKTVTLETTMLNVLMAHLGFYIFAKKGELCQFDDFAYVSEDMQDVSRGISTFGAEIISLTNIISRATSMRCFILLDEIIRGTNPEEGKRLLQAILFYLSQHKSFVFLATHYDGLLEENNSLYSHFQIIGLKNANFSEIESKIEKNQQHSIEILQQYMDYRNEIVCNTSDIPNDALKVAQLLGFPSSILELIKFDESSEK